MSRIYCEDVPIASAPSSDKEVGIDIGLKIFAYLSDGTTIENPRFYRQEEKNPAKAQRKRDKAPKKSKDRTQLNKRVTRVHERTKNRRKHFAHQPASQGRERVPVHRCRGPGSAQYGQKSEIGEKYCRCGLVAVLCIPSKQSGRGWQRVRRLTAS